MENINIQSVLDFLNHDEQNNTKLINYSWVTDNGQLHLIIRLVYLD